MMTMSAENIAAMVRNTLVDSFDEFASRMQEYGEQWSGEYGSNWGVVRMGTFLIVKMGGDEALVIENTRNGLEFSKLVGEARVAM